MNKLCQLHIKGTFLRRQEWLMQLLFTRPGSNEIQSHINVSVSIYKWGLVKTNIARQVGFTQLAHVTNTQILQL